MNFYYNSHVPEQFRTIELQNSTFDFTGDSVRASSNIFLSLIHEIGFTTQFSTSALSQTAKNEKKLSGITEH